MSIFRCRWQRRLDWRAGRKFSGNCWIGVNYAWCDLKFQPSAKIGRSPRSVKVGFDTLSLASHPSQSVNSPLKSGLSQHLFAGHHELSGLGARRTPSEQRLTVGGDSTSHPARRLSWPGARSPRVATPSEVLSVRLRERWFS